METIIEDNTSPHLVLLQLCAKEDLYKEFQKTDGQVTSRDHSNRILQGFSQNTSNKLIKF